jgi:hypothetical protein
MNTRLQRHYNLVSILLALRPCVLVLTTCESRLFYEKFVAASLREAIRGHARKLKDSL